MRPRSRACCLAMLLCHTATQPGTAQAPVFTRDMDGLRVEIGASHGQVRVVTRWPETQEPVVLALHENIINSPGPSRLPFSRNVVRVYLSPDTVRRFLRDAAGELAVPDSIRFPKSGINRITVTIGVRAIAGFDGVRTHANDSALSSYGFATWSCRDQRLATYTSRENWLAILDALRRAADSAQEQQRTSLATGRGASESGPYSADEIPCPSRPFAGNPAIRRDSASDSRDTVHTSTVEFVVDTLGRILPRSMRLAEGDSALFVATRRDTRTWRFAPALDADRRPVAEGVRMLVFDRTPVSAADTARLFTFARTAHATLVTAAVETQRRARERWIASTDAAVRLHVLTFGTAPRVVFVHALGGSAEQWSDVATQLQPAVSSVAYDLRGHGGSTRSIGADYSIGAHVADLRAVLDSAKVPRAVLVAHGTACAIAAELARRMPERVEALVLLGPTARDSSATMPERLAQFGEALGTRYRIDGAGVALADFFGSADDQALLRKRIFNDVRATPPDALAASLASTRSYDVVQAVAAYTGRTYVVFPGLRSGLWFPGQFPMYEWKPGAGVETLRVTVSRAADLGEWAPVLEPGALSAHLRRVLTEVDERR